MSSFTLHYSEDLVRQAALTRWRKSIGLTYPVVLVLLAVYTGYRISIGDVSWYTGALGVIVVMSVAVIIATYAAVLHRAMTHFRQMGQPQATLELSDDRFRITSDLVSSEIRWPVITRIWCYETFWLMFFSRTQSMILPLADLPQETQDFIIQKVRDHGGKVA